MVLLSGRRTTKCHLLCTGRQKDGRLPGRIAAADQRDFIVGAEIRFKRRSPVMDGNPLEQVEIGNVEPPVAGA